jgi:hypothetical protein
LQPDSSPHRAGSWCPIKRQSQDVIGSRLRIAVRGRIRLADPEPLGVDVAGRYFDREHPCDQTFPWRLHFAGRQDQDAWRLGGSQRAVGLQASAAGAVGSGAQQSIGLAPETRRSATFGLKASMTRTRRMLRYIKENFLARYWEFESLSQRYRQSSEA